MAGLTWGDLLLAVAAVAYIVVVLAVFGPWRRPFDQAPLDGSDAFDQAPLVDDRRGWCSVCGREIRGADLHTVWELPDDPAEGEARSLGGGTAVGAEFCPEHVPAG